MRELVTTTEQLELGRVGFECLEGCETYLTNHGDKFTVMTKVTGDCQVARSPIFHDTLYQPPFPLAGRKSQGYGITAPGAPPPSPYVVIVGFSSQGGYIRLNCAKRGHPASKPAAKLCNIVKVEAPHPTFLSHFKMFEARFVLNRDDIFDVAAHFSLILFPTCRSCAGQFGRISPTDAVLHLPCPSSPFSNCNICKSAAIKRLPGR
ncbi:hypothetical protein QBC35DRAFT_546338 [Podospora australis]|uniref:Uncharacterized protein n=1 Tax=Podospora australis TaxID=1536484 RepID=A0AAN6WLT6_9PEZI|nr:hypothetical protein QBC35DRAFT_546338 [Podospora australis]